jgi:transcriptional regulator with XRE-family HTH domain
VKISDKIGDEAIMEELGRRFAQCRIDSGLTQEELALKAGIGKRTLERLEKGLQVQTGSLVRLLRSLRLLDSLDMLVPSVDIRPMDLLKLGKNRRQRASSRQKSSVSQTPWVWGDEK